MINSDKLLEICEKYENNNYFAGNNIPPKKVRNARASLGVPFDEEVIALIDLTIFGSAKDALIITNRGIYAKNVFETPQQLRWEILKYMRITETKEAVFDHFIMFNDGRRISTGGAPNINSVLKQLINELIEELNTDKDHREWHIAVGEKQQGPNNIKRIKKVDINNAGLDELLLLPWMTLDYVQSIIKERQNRLGFTALEEVGELLDLKPHQVEQLRNYIIFRAYTHIGDSTASKRIIDY